MNRFRGFTLIELLVVVSIIALLIAILLPSLGKARRMAKTAKCLASARGISQSMNIYMADYSGPMAYHNVGNTYWSQSLAPYGGGQANRQCPEAMGPNPNYSPGSTAQYQGSSTFPWANFAISTPVDTGCYTLNGWIYRGGDSMTAYALDPGTFWAFPYSRSASNIPLASDGSWPDAWPEYGDSAPSLQQESDGSGGDNNNQMLRVAIARHGKAVNVAFMDSHAETVPLQKLWTLQWHSSWITPNTLPTIP